MLKVPSVELQRAASQVACHLAFDPVLAHGRLELLRYLREIAICINYHRYGNLGLRETQTRKPLPEAS